MIVDGAGSADQLVAPSVDERPKFVLSPHEGFVSLNWHPGLQRWVLAHSVTTERVTLPATTSEWSMEWNSQNLAWVFEVTEDSPRVFEVDDLLKYRLFHKLGGVEEYMVEFKDGMGQPDRRSLEYLFAEHRYGDCCLNLGFGLAKDKLPFACFVVPRGGCHIFWELKAVVDFILAAPRSATTFIQKYIMAWNRALGLLQLDECLRSSQYEHQREVGEDRRRVLRFISTGSAGLVALLSKWVSLLPNKGGLKGGEAKANAASLLQAFVDLAAGDGGSFTLYLSDLPARHELVDMPVGRRGVRIGFTGNFNLDFSALAPVVERLGRSAPVSLFLQALPSEALDNCPCLVALQKAWGSGCASNKFADILKQLVWVIGARLDACVAEAADVREWAAPLGTRVHAGTNRGSVRQVGRFRACRAATGI